VAPDTLSVKVRGEANRTPSEGGIFRRDRNFSRAALWGLRDGSSNHCQITPCRMQSESHRIVFSVRGSRVDRLLVEQEDEEIKETFEQEARELET
jgi:hypothetical protein